MAEQVVAEEKVYRLSRAGRRMAYLLLAGGVLIWLFALWTLKNTLQIGVRNFLPSLERLGKRLVGTEGSIPPEEAIPAVIMLVLAIVVPLLIWNIVEELRSSYQVGPAGITFRSWGVELSYPWAEIADLRPVDEEAEEPLDELIVRTSRLSEIRSPVARFLHWQAYGRHKLPLYGGLEEREELIVRVRAHMAAARAGGEEPTTGEAGVEAADAGAAAGEETVEAGAGEAVAGPAKTGEGRVEGSGATDPLAEAG